MRYTYIKYALSVAIAVAALCSCSELAVELPFAGTEQTHDPAGEMVEIMLRVPSLATRTSIGPDDGKNLTPVWADGDSFGLYIEYIEEDGTSKVVGPYKFTHRANNEHDKADNIFVGQLEKAMISEMFADEYTYHAVYPYSESFVVDGSSIGCSIAAVQSGRYGGDADIMYASAVGSKLSRTFFNDLGFEFRHLTHALKIHLPANVFEGRGVTGLGINFPQPVSGDMKIDMASGEPQLSGTGNGVTVRFDEPTTDECDIWVYINPGNMSGGAVRFVVTDGTEYSFPLTSKRFGNLEARHITPVSLGEMTLREQVDYTITVNHSQLGESVTVLNSLTLPDGYMFPGLEMSPTITDITSPTPDEFKIKMFKDEAVRLESSGVTSLSMIMESEHAENLGAKGPCKLSGVSTEGLTVESPYLFFEDFSGVSNYTTSGTDGQSLDPSGLIGWSGDQVSTYAAGYITLNAAALSKAIVTTTQLSNIKQGYYINIKLVVDVSGNRSKPLSSSAYEGIAYLTERTGNLGYSGTGSFNSDESKSFNYTNNSSMVTREVVFTNKKASSNARLAIGHENTPAASPVFTIDNIRVSIVQ